MLGVRFVRVGEGDATERREDGKYQTGLGRMAYLI